MKKLCFIGLVLLWSAVTANAQLSVYDDIDLGPNWSDLQNLPNPGEWGVTHSTPSYAGTYAYGTGETTLWMWADDTSGEGVYRRINFAENSNYTLGIGITSFEAAAGVNGRFTVLLANDPLVPNLVCSACPIPTFSGTRVLYTYHGNSFINNMLDLRFSTTPGESYKYLVIYPNYTTDQQPYDPLAWENRLEITCLTAYGCPLADRTFCKNIPSGATSATNLYIGSSYCSSSVMVNSAKNPSTYLTAAETIDVRPTTTLSVDPGSTITMEVIPCFVGDITPGGTVKASLIPKTRDGLCYYSKTPNTGLSEPEKKEALDLYPNPTSGTLHVVLPSGGAMSTISVLRWDGKVLQTKISSAKEEIISLKEYPAGIYMVRISSGTNNIVRKVVKTD